MSFVDANHQTAMLAYVLALAPGNSGARDLLQEVNITLWQKRGSFELGTNFKAWAFQTIRYHMLNHRLSVWCRRVGWCLTMT